MDNFLKAKSLEPVDEETALLLLEWKPSYVVVLVKFDFEEEVYRMVDHLQLEGRTWLLHDRDQFGVVEHATGGVSNEVKTLKLRLLCF